MKTPLVMVSKFFLFSLTGVWCIAIGLRFLLAPSEAVYEGTVYVVNDLDRFFDWGILLVLGVIMFVFSIVSAYRYDKQVKNKRGVVE